MIDRARAARICFVAVSSLLPVVAAAQATSPYVRTVIVSPTPGSASASGQTLLQALAAINGAGSLDRWLLKVEPGVYDVGTTPVQMKSWVDMEGSGIGETLIRGTGQADETFSFVEGVLKGAQFTELRDLTVECVATTANPSCITIANFNVSPRYTRVKAVSTSAVGVHWGFRNTNASPLFDQVEVLVASGTINYGIVNAGFTSRPTIRRSFVKATNGSSTNDGILNTDDSSPIVEDSTIWARGGSQSAGIRAIESQPGAAPMLLDQVSILADNATFASYGLVDGLYKVVVRHGKLDTGGTNSSAIYMPSADVTVTHSELTGQSVLAEATSVSLGATRIIGGGAITGYQTERCASLFDNQFVFYPNTCP